MKISGIIVKKIRKSLGMNQTEFGEMMGVDQATISDIENNKTKPSKPFIKYFEFRFLKKEPAYQELSSTLPIPDIFSHDKLDKALDEIISNIKDMYSSKDPVLTTGTSANIDAILLTTHMVKHNRLLEKHIEGLTSQLETLKDIIKEHKPPEEVKKERRKGWPILRKVVGF